MMAGRTSPVTMGGKRELPEVQRRRLARVSVTGLAGRGEGREGHFFPVSGLKRGTDIPHDTVFSLGMMDPDAGNDMITL